MAKGVTQKHVNSLAAAEMAKIESRIITIEDIRVVDCKRPLVSACGRVDKHVIASHARDVDTNDSVRVER